MEVLKTHNKKLRLWYYPKKIKIIKNLCGQMSQITNILIKKST